jgi:hypothetical protein
MVMFSCLLMGVKYEYLGKSSLNKLSEELPLH